VDRHVIQHIWKVIILVESG